MVYPPPHDHSQWEKIRLVYNYSFEYEGLYLKDSLLPGPVLSTSLLGVLWKFREHCVAISGDICGMFHQVLVLPEDRQLLNFLWRDFHRDVHPDTYKCQVLIFGTTCSLCCATFTLQWHVALHSNPENDVKFSVDRCFYVDNCLQSLPTFQEAWLDRLRTLLTSGGFDIWQWTSDVGVVVSHLPSVARSHKLELWLSQNKADPQESTYMLSGGNQGEHQLAFLLAQSRVTQWKKYSIPRLGLCAALIGAQLGKLLTAQLTVNLDKISYWTVQKHWKSDSVSDGANLHIHFK